MNWEARLLLIKTQWIRRYAKKFSYTSVTLMVKCFKKE